MIYVWPSAARIQSLYGRSCALERNAGRQWPSRCASRQHTGLCGSPQYGKEPQHQETNRNQIMRIMADCLRTPIYIWENNFYIIPYSGHFNISGFYSPLPSGRLAIFPCDTFLPYVGPKVFLFSQAGRPHSVFGVRTSDWALGASPGATSKKRRPKVFNRVLLSGAGKMPRTE